MNPQMQAKIRAWVTPITVVVFLLLAGSGFLMQAHQKGLSGLHEILGYIFCAIAVAHIALNWRILIAQMKSTKAVMAIVLLGVLSSLIWVGAARGEQGKRSGGGHHGQLSTQNSAPDANIGAQDKQSSIGQSATQSSGQVTTGQTQDKGSSEVSKHQQSSTRGSARNENHRAHNVELRD